MIVTLMARGICWIDKVRDDLNNAFWRELSEALIEAYNIIDTSSVKNQPMMPIYFFKVLEKPFMEKLEWNILC